jgi:2-oxoglutarate ferredoxin oxidoreductase subunit beta
MVEPSPTATLKASCALAPASAPFFHWLIRKLFLVFEDMRLKVVTVGQDGYTLDKILTHDAHTKDTTLHSMLAAMKYPDYPVALGVIRSVEDEIVYDQAVEKQVEEVKAQSKIHCVDDLLHSGATWEI